MILAILTVHLALAVLAATTHGLSAHDPRTQQNEGEAHDWREGDRGVGFNSHITGGNRG